MDTSVRSVASHTRWKTATPYTQKRYLNIGVNPQGRETVKQEEEIGQETSREERIEVRVGRGQERKISLEKGFNLLTLEKQLVE